MIFFRYNLNSVGLSIMQTGEFKGQGKSKCQLLIQAKLAVNNQLEFP